MKNFFKKFWKKLKACLGWAVFLIGLTIYILYDVMYNSKLQWRVFFERLPLFLLLGAAGIAVILIMKKKGALKNNGKKGGTTDGTAAGSGDEESGRDGDLNAPLREEEKNSNEKNDNHTDGNVEK